MKIVIIGGGKVAYHLANALHREHVITIVESDAETAKYLANKLSVEVVFGDGTTVAVLSQVCDGADILMSLTGLDEVNLIACQVGKKYFHIPTAIARVNNPRNFEVMGLFGVDKVFSGTKLLAEMIEQEIIFSGLRIVHQIENSDRVLCEFVLSEQSAACNRTLIEYDFVKDSRVVLITTKDGGVVTPVGSTVMRGGDTMMMVCPRKRLEAIWKGMVHF